MGKAPLAARRAKPERKEVVAAVATAVTVKGEVVGILARVAITPAEGRKAAVQEEMRGRKPRASERCDLSIRVSCEGAGRIRVLKKVKRGI